jgi:hypothetical protein
MQLVAGFARQLQASVDWAAPGGTQLHLKFPVLGVGAS